MTDLVVTLFVSLIALIFFAALLAPLETLSWWGGMSNDELTSEPAGEPAPSPDGDSAGKHYAVYLSGIGSISGDEAVPAEVPFLAALQEALPEYDVLADVYPYSVTNNGLTGQRMMSGIFRWAGKRRWEKDSFTDFLINGRNTLQVAVSADQRYGPVFNFAVARVIRDKLVEHGYQVGSGDRVALIGYSGGAQISIGVTPYLEAMILAPIRVISLAGVMTGDNGIDDTEHLYHIFSEVDELEKFGSIAFPGRWPIFTNSGWNTALRTGKLTLLFQPGRTHALAKSYVDPETIQPDGRSNMAITVGQIADCVRTESGTVVNQGGLSPDQLANLVSRLREANPEAAETLVAMLAESGLAQQSAVARSAMAVPAGKSE